MSLPPEDREYLVEALEGPLGNALVEIVFDEIVIARKELGNEARKREGSFAEVARAQGRLDGMLQIVRALYTRSRADVPVTLQRLLEER